MSIILMPPRFKLPAELWLEIFSHLPYSDLCSLLSVNHNFHTLMQPSAPNVKLTKPIDVHFFRDDPVDKNQAIQTWDDAELHPLLSKFFSKELIPADDKDNKSKLGVSTFIDNSIYAVYRQLDKFLDLLSTSGFTESRMAKENAVSPCLKELHISVYKFTDKRFMSSHVPAKNKVTVRNILIQAVVQLLRTARLLLKSNYRQTKEKRHWWTDFDRFTWLLDEAEAVLYDKQQLEFAKDREYLKPHKADDDGEETNGYIDELVKVQTRIINLHVTISIVI